jgi:uncharacterized damage-inducible protein DinB
MNLRDLLTLYDYNYWAIRRVLTAGARVTPEQFLAPTAHSFGSLRGTLVHILDTECGWRMLCQHQTLTSFEDMKEASFPTLGVLQQRWNEEERAMSDYLSRLTDEDLIGYVRYTLDNGQKRERVLWHCLVHVVNHGTHHRSMAAAILRGYGCSPGELDFTMYLNQAG